MNHDRVKAFREKLDNLNITDYYGLKSPGLTCYLNSVLQVLFMSRDFREAIQRSQDSTAFDPHLRILFATLEKSAAKTHSITGELGITDVYEQHDAAEYFEKILRRTSLKASKIFKGELNHKTTCLQCKQSNDSRSCFWILPLMVKDSHHLVYSVEKGLSAFFKGEMICGDNKMYCSQCNGKQDVEIVSDKCKVLVGIGNCPVFRQLFSSYDIWT
uniref:ubiquitin carboxyl-terminal hydrolase 47-like n=1 Tax=Monopterus albus TaxID=43700 RepID=UPI0009B494F0|nr:ubiquitin carboxyl-terminal hydrolase 47-like [Monopterus albus]